MGWDRMEPKRRRVVVETRVKLGRGKESILERGAEMSQSPKARKLFLFWH